MKRFLLIPALLVSLVSLAWAPAVLAPTAWADGETIHIVDATSRPTPIGITAGVVYLVLMNHGAEDDRLVGISTPIANKAELHRSAIENGISKMQAVPDFTIKANDGVTFKPGGLHIMLIGLKQTLKVGDSFPVTLTFAKAGPVEITVAVQPLAAKSRTQGTKAPGMTGMPGMKM